MCFRKYVPTNIKQNVKKLCLSVFSLQYLLLDKRGEVETMRKEKIECYESFDAPNQNVAF